MSARRGARGAARDRTGHSLFECSTASGWGGFATSPAPTGKKIPLTVVVDFFRAARPARPGWRTIFHTGPAQARRRAQGVTIQEIPRHPGRAPPHEADLQSKTRARERPTLLTPIRILPQMAPKRTPLTESPFRLSAQDSAKEQPHALRPQRARYAPSPVNSRKLTPLSQYTLSPSLPFLTTCTCGLRSKNLRNSASRVFDAKPLLVMKSPNAS